MVDVVDEVIVFLAPMLVLLKVVVVLVVVLYMVEVF